MRHGIYEHQDTANLGSLQKAHKIFCFLFSVFRANHHLFMILQFAFDFFHYNCKNDSFHPISWNTVMFLGKTLAILVEFGTT